MSLINKMLQDLDRRQALAGATDTSVVQVRTAAAEHRGGREWLWRIVAVLLTLGLGWVIWVGYQLLPKPLVTRVGLRAASEAQTRPIPAQPAPPAPSVTPPPPAPSVTAPPPAPAAVVDPTPAVASEARPVAPADTLRLARAIETPVRAPEAASGEPAKQEPAKAPKLTAVAPGVAKGTVDKRERVHSAAETAEAQFRRAAVLLNQGRLSEAEDQLAGALRADPSHVAARQTYVAMLLEQHRVEAARRLVQEALAINPAQPAFAVALARIYIEQRDYRNALEVLDKAGPAARDAEFQAMRGAVLQRLGKHAEAVEAYQNAIRIAPQPGTTWVGLGISLETLGRRPEAAQAYRRALDAGSLAAEAREYAESRARALE
jgi:MSHA biogenesis protein MshN